MCKDVSDKVCDNLHVMYEKCLFELEVYEKKHNYGWYSHKLSLIILML